MDVRIDDRLIEAVVEEAERLGRIDSCAYHAERDPIYALRGPRARERAHHALHRRYFRELGIERELGECLAAFPELDAAISSCLLSRVSREKDEAAELFVSPDDGHTDTRDRCRVVVGLLPRTILDEKRLGFVLRRELRTIADMVDPTFGYTPELPSQGFGRTHDRLLLDRYAALWSATVLGRMARDGFADASAKDHALARLRSVFPGRDPAVLSGFFDGPRPTHRALVSFATAPHGDARENGARCALCGFPSFRPIRGEDLDAAVQSSIRLDFPCWSARERLCPQCADLYRARSVPPDVRAEHAEDA